jgi:hypothetical protein
MAGNVERAALVKCSAGRPGVNMLEPCSRGTRGVGVQGAGHAFRFQRLLRFKDQGTRFNLIWFQRGHVGHELASALQVLDSKSVST